MLQVYAVFAAVFVATGRLPFGFALANLWLAALVVIAGTILLVRAVWRHRILTPGQLILLAALWVVYALAWYAAAQLDGGVDAEMPAAMRTFQAAWVLAPFGVLLLAPWSMWKVRHQ